MASRTRFGTSRAVAAALALTVVAAGARAGGQQAGGAQTAEDPRIEVAVDARVELLSLVFRLAGRPEYNQEQSNSPYGRETDAVFAPFRDHRAIGTAQRLARERGISYDAVMSFAVHLSDVATLGQRVPFDRPPAALERRWNADAARAFLAELADFVEVTGFREFAAEHADFYARAAGRLQAAVNELPLLEWFDRFFGARQGARFRVVVGLLNGPANYGVRVVLADGSEEITPVIGAEAWDAEGLPVFGPGFMELLAHEFCHSYTNPIVDRHMDALRGTGQKLFTARRKQMESQAYGSIGPVLYETVVRACVGRFVLETGGEQRLKTYVDSNHGRGFVWTAELVELLAEYEADRTRYPDLDAFMPRLAERLAELAGD